MATRKTTLSKAVSVRYTRPSQGRNYILTFPDGDARLELMSRPDTIAADPSKPNIGFIHVSFSVGSKEAVDAKTEELLSAGNGQ